MGLNEKIEKVFKEKSGSVAKNRLSIQSSYAIKLLIDFYDYEDFIILLDCIEDIAAKVIQDETEKIYLYQLKTRNKAFTLTYILKQEWLNKLLKHNKEFSNYEKEINLVTNEFIVENNSNICANEKSNIEIDILHKENEINTNLDKIKKKIAETENLDISSINLSDFYFIKTNFHLDTHKDQAYKIISDFIEKLEPNIEVKKVKSFFNSLYSTLDDRFNYELDPQNTNYNEIKEKKGFSKDEFKVSLNEFLSLSFPDLSYLFLLLNIKSIAEQKGIKLERPNYLMDALNKEPIFIKFINIVDKYIAESNSDELLNQGVDILLNNKDVTEIYKRKNYIKCALAYRYFDYINKGDEK